MGETWLTGLACAASWRSSDGGPPRSRVTRESWPSKRTSVRSVGGWIPGDHGRDRVGGQPRQRGQRPARRLAPYAEAVRIDAQGPGEGPQVPQSGLDVVELGGKVCLTGEAVVDGRDGNAGLDQSLEDGPGGHGLGEVPAVPGHERTAVDPHDHRNRTRPRGHVEVEQQRPVARGKGEADALVEPSPSSQRTGSDGRQVEIHDQAQRRRGWFPSR